MVCCKMGMDGSMVRNGLGIGIVFGFSNLRHEGGVCCLDEIVMGITCRPSDGELSDSDSDLEVIKVEAVGSSSICCFSNRFSNCSRSFFSFFRSITSSIEGITLPRK